MRGVLKIFTVLLLVLAFSVTAQENDGKDDKENGKDEKKKPKTIAELTENTDRFEGFFTLFRDKKTGETSMLVRKDQVDKEFIYWMHVARGTTEKSLFRGRYGDSRMISIRRHFDRIEFVAENKSFYFDPENPLSRSSEANIPSSLLAVEKILAEDEQSGDVLIKADRLFKSEAFAQITPSPLPDEDSKRDFSLGKLNGDKTKILNLRSYPLNTDVEVEYVFSNPHPRVLAGPDITDERNIGIKVMHSFIEAPENDYRTRRDDARMGFFMIERTDLTSNDVAPYRDVIRRWHLVKKNPAAELSEPVEPITWWIENTTPLEWRDLIRDAALRWNQSFEKAGFRNALVVKVQPDDAEWDAGDIRYNVLRWVSSPNPPFGGYGPSFSDPRTGQQLGADVMLEYAFMGRYLRARRLMQDNPALASGDAESRSGEPYCMLGNHLQMNTVFAQAAMDAAGYGDDDELQQRLTHDAMSYLILHEIGHTLAMYHNMKATQYLSPQEAFDAEVVAEKGLAGSVMDYPAINFAPSREQQTRFYATHPGPYDDWLIEYGYSPALDDPVAEAERLEAILARSNVHGLAFGNDADDMRSPGSGIDPRVNILDMSSDAISYASEQMKLMRDTLEKMSDFRPAEGSSYQETFDGSAVMMRLWERSAAVVSRYIGGVYVDRSVVGQQGATQPFTPVEEARQREAMQVLAEQVFAPQAFDLPAGLLTRIARQRRGDNHSENTEDPKVHDTVLMIQKGVLDQLLHPVVLNRITDSMLYGNQYSLAEMISDLTAAIFEADARGNVNSMRQNLQMEYVTRLAKMVRNGHGTHGRAMAIYTLNAVKELLARKRGVDVATQAHVQSLKLLIDRALDTGA